MGVGGLTHRLPLSLRAIRIAGLGVYPGITFRFEWRESKRRWLSGKDKTPPHKKIKTHGWRGITRDILKSRIDIHRARAIGIVYT